LRRAGRFVLALVPFLILTCGAAVATAQDAPGAPDSTAAVTSAPDSAAKATFPLFKALPPGDERLDRDRFEWGVAAVQGYFDWLGTVGYRHYVREAGPFQQNIAMELAGGKKGYLSEGSVSLLWLFRPLRTFRPEWRIRPLLEFGPGAHLVVQVADIEGFADTGFHTNAYGKVHAYAGFEALLGRRWGILLRGRFTTPANRPLDYAQAAIFLR